MAMVELAGTTRRAVVRSERFMEWQRELIRGSSYSARKRRENESECHQPAKKCCMVKKSGTSGSGSGSDEIELLLPDEDKERNGSNVAAASAPPPAGGNADEDGGLLGSRGIKVMAKKEQQHNHHHHHHHHHQQQQQQQQQVHHQVEHKKGLNGKATKMGSKHDPDYHKPPDEGNCRMRRCHGSSKQEQDQQQQLGASPMRRTQRRSSEQPQQQQQHQSDQRSFRFLTRNRGVSPPVIPAAAVPSKASKRSKRVAQRLANEEPPPPPLKLPKLHLVLTRKEIQEDWMKITGHKYSGKPKKSTLIQRGLALCTALTCPSSIRYLNDPQSGWMAACSTPTSPCERSPLASSSAPRIARLAKHHGSVRSVYSHRGLDKRKKGTLLYSSKHWAGSPRGSGRPRVAVPIGEVGDALITNSGLRASDTLLVVNFGPYLRRLPIKRVCVWATVALVLFQLRDFVGVIMGTIVLSMIGNTFISWAEEYLPGRRRFLIATMYVVIIAVLTGLGIMYIPRLLQEGANIIGRIQLFNFLQQSENPYSLLSEKLKSALGENVTDQLERFLLAVMRPDSVVRESMAGNTAQRSIIFQQLIKEYSGAMVAWLATLISATSRFALQSFVSLIFSFLFVWDAPSVKAGIQSLKQTRLSVVYEEIAPVDWILTTELGGFDAHLKLHPLLALGVLVFAEHALGVWGLIAAVPMAVFFIEYVIKRNSCYQENV
ncbi:hypothetical protein SELMODRAFT_446935 [Selaginella moellendorffii]|uniref:Uncharacterized protein n=2 Tax=Selaginella moellendorffii TaxID=88036 RepID=D8SVF0_SELML|nr:hypothetical protein SELMODRAFT_446935 [Selaginella moellendorffii]